MRAVAETAGARLRDYDAPVTNGLRSGVPKCPQERIRGGFA